MEQDQLRSPLRVGHLLDIDVPSPDDAQPSDMSEHLVRLAVAAEEAALDGVFLPDRHMRPTTLAPSQVVNAASIAANTSRIGVGTYCSVLPLYNPMQFAEDWAAVDQLSGGRVTVSVGSGYSPEYQRFFGLSGRPARARFEESVALVRQAWEGSLPWSWSGDYFDYDDVRLLPGCFEARTPSIWIAGHGDAAVRLAVRQGDGLAGDPFPMPVDSWTARIKRIREGVQARTGAAAEIAMLRHVYVTDSEKEAARVVENVCLPLFRFYWEQGLLRGRLPEGAEITQSVVREAVIVGDANYCAERLLSVAHTYDLTYVLFKLIRPDFSAMRAEREIEDVRSLTARIRRMMRPD